MRVFMRNMKARVLNRINDRNIKTAIAAFVSLAIMIGAIFSIGVGYTVKTNADIADGIIRFHVVANSDSADDQRLKSHIKDAVIGYMEPLLKESKSIEETRTLINENMNNIKNLAEDMVEDYGRDYSINIMLDEANFPTKQYGDVVLPAGRYEACRIIIGEGEGENWWCVMFPPLCYLDAATGVVPIEGKEELKEVLNEEQYEIITNHKAEYEVRFKILDTIGAWLNPNDYSEVD